MMSAVKRKRENSEVDEDDETGTKMIKTEGKP